MSTNAQDVFDQLSVEELAAVEQFSAAWPVQIPHNDVSFLELHNIAKASAPGQPLTKAALDAAATSFISTIQAARATFMNWVKTACPAGLKDGSGSLTTENADVLYSLLDGKAITNETLNEALRDATQQRILRWTGVAPQTGAKAANRNTMSGYIDHSANADANSESTETIRRWMTTLPRSLFNNENLFDSGNFQRLMAVIQTELKGVVTPKTLEVGLILLKSRGQLVTFTEPLSPEAQSAAMLAQQDAAQNKRDLANRYNIPTEADQIKAMHEGEAAARERVVALHKNASPRTQKRIEALMVAHKNISPAITLAETTALLATERAYEGAGSLTPHATAVQVQQGIEEIIECEREVAIAEGDPAYSSALWTRIAYRTEELINKGYSAGPGRGDNRGFQEVRTGIARGRSIQ